MIQNYKNWENEYLYSPPQLNELFLQIEKEVKNQVKLENKMSRHEKQKMAKYVINDVINRVKLLYSKSKYSGNLVIEEMSNYVEESIERYKKINNIQSEKTLLRSINNVQGSWFNPLNYVPDIILPRGPPMFDFDDLVPFIEEETIKQLSVDTYLTASQKKYLINEIIKDTTQAIDASFALLKEQIYSREGMLDLLDNIAYYVSFYLKKNKEHFLDIPSSVSRTNDVFFKIFEETNYQVNLETKMSRHQKQKMATYVSDYVVDRIKDMYKQRTPENILNKTFPNLIEEAINRYKQKNSIKSSKTNILPKTKQPIPTNYFGFLNRDIFSSKGLPIITTDDLVPFIEEEALKQVTSEIYLTEFEKESMIDRIIEDVTEYVDTNLFSVLENINNYKDIPLLRQNIANLVTDYIKNIEKYEEGLFKESGSASLIHKQINGQVAELASKTNMSAAQQNSITKVAKEIVKEEVKQAIAHVSAQTNQSPRLSATQIKKEIPQMVAAAIEEVISPKIQTQKHSPITIAYNNDNNMLSPKIQTRKRSSRTIAYNKYREDVLRNKRIYKTRGNRAQTYQEVAANKKRARANQQTLNKNKPNKRKTVAKSKGKNGKTAAKKPAAKGNKGKKKTQRR